MKNSNCWYSDVCTNDCTGSCIRYLEMEYLMNTSNIPKVRQRPTVLYAPKCDYDAFVRLSEIKDNFVDFVAGGGNVYIASTTTGNGKTSWAIKLMLKYFDEVWAGNGFKPRGIFVHTPTFLLKTKDFESRDREFMTLRQRLHSVDLVVWDDIASTEVSAYDYSQLLMYIDTRTAGGLSNIYTGNLTDEAMLIKSLGAKLTSRIWSNDTEVIIFKGGDRR
jgi:DNA replication protein DnaC